MFEHPFAGQHLGHERNGLPSLATHCARQGSAARAQGHLAGLPVARQVAVEARRQQVGQGGDQENTRRQDGTLVGGFAAYTVRQYLNTTTKCLLFIL